MLEELAVVSCYLVYACHGVVACLEKASVCTHAIKLCTAKHFVTSGGSKYILKKTSRCKNRLVLLGLLLIFLTFVLLALRSTCKIQPNINHCVLHLISLIRWNNVKQLFLVIQFSHTANENSSLIYFSFPPPCQFLAGKLQKSGFLMHWKKSKLLEMRYFS